MTDRELLKSLLKLHSIKVAGPGEPEFKLASGGTSRFYLDIKKTALCSRAHLPLAALLFDAMVKEFGPTFAVAGVALGGCHLASIVALYARMKHNLEIDAVYVRSEPKDHGTGAVIERPAGAGRTVLLEDVVTTGGSSLRAAEALRAAGFDVVGVLAIVDRRKEKVAWLGHQYPFRALYTFGEIIEDDLVGGIA